MTDHDRKLLAVILHMRRQNMPRRHLKRALRDVGMGGTAAALNELLDRLDSLTDVERAEVEREAARLAEDEQPQGPPPLLHDDWLIAENVTCDRTYIVYHGADAAFIAEVFDSEAEAPAGHEHAPLDEGQVLSNVVWLDEKPQNVKECHRLYSRAREALRMYDIANEDGARPPSG